LLAGQSTTVRRTVPRQNRPILGTLPPLIPAGSAVDATLAFYEQKLDVVTVYDTGTSTEAVIFPPPSRTPGSFERKGAHALVRIGDGPTRHRRRAGLYEDSAVASPGQDAIIKGHRLFRGGHGKIETAQGSTSYTALRLLFGGAAPTAQENRTDVSATASTVYPITVHPRWHLAEHGLSAPVYRAARVHCPVRAPLPPQMWRGVPVPETPWHWDPRRRRAPVPKQVATD
jgi:hypothetical protein